MKNGKNPTPKKNISNIFKEFTYLVGETFRKLSAESDPMRDAIKNGEVDKVESLLNKGANPDNIERSWYTPLVLSITYKQYGCALLLLQMELTQIKNILMAIKNKVPYNFVLIIIILVLLDY